MENVHEIEKSNKLFIFWLVVTLIFTVITVGMLVPLLIIPLYIHIYLKKLKYYYDDKNFVIEKGVIFHNKEIIPINNIDSFEARNLFGTKFINIRVKGILKSLMYVKNPQKEVDIFFINNN